MKKALFLAITSMILVLAGCSSNAGIGGTRGVEINFMTGNPPTTLYKGEPLSIVVEMRNNGIYPNPDDFPGSYFDGKLYLYGYDPSQIESFFPKQIPSDFYGRQSDGEGGYLEGSYTTLTFTSSSVNLPSGVNSADTKIMASVCYKYRTVSSPTVCVDPDPYTTKIKNKPCSIDQVSMSSQYGPVVVSSVKEIASGDLVKFKISISNVGGGLIIDTNYMNNCPFSLDYTNTDTVYVSGILSSTNIYCDNNGKLHMKDGSGTILCSVSKPVENSAFKAPLRINLDYGYIKTIQTNLKILNS
jgi:hypothetical protein